MTLKIEQCLQYTMYYMQLCTMYTVLYKCRFASRSKHQYHIGINLIAACTHVRMDLTRLYDIMHMSFLYHHNGRTIADVLRPSANSYRRFDLQLMTNRFAYTDQFTHWIRGSRCVDLSLDDFFSFSRFCM